MAFRMLRGLRSIRPSSLAGFGSPAAPAPSPRTTLHHGMLPTTTTTLPHVTPASCRWRSLEREAILRAKVEAKFRKRLKRTFDKGEDRYDPDTPEGQAQLDKIMMKYDRQRSSSDDAKRRRRAAKKRENAAIREEKKRQNPETANRSAVLEGLSSEEGMTFEEFKAGMGSAWRSNEEFNEERQQQQRREAREEEDEDEEESEEEDSEDEQEPSPADDAWSKEWYKRRRQ